MSRNEFDTKKNKLNEWNLNIFFKNEMNETIIVEIFDIIGNSYI